MRNDKSYLRKKSLLLRKKKHLSVKKFDFNLIFKLIKKNFLKKKITIGGYYPSNYEVNILNFIEKASKNKFKIALPIIKPLGKMSFKCWNYKDRGIPSKFRAPTILDRTIKIISSLEKSNAFVFIQTSGICKK